MSKTISEIIIRDGFFSIDLPSEFTSEPLASVLERIEVSKSKLSKRGVNKWSKLVQYSIPKKNVFRRIASIPHPLHYIKLSKLIEDNWNVLELHYDKSEVSLSKLEYSQDRIRHKYSFSTKQEVRLENLAFNRYILTLDINRYYPSIYTHSIPWALHTKLVAKANPRDMTLLGNKIDLEIRNMQDGQTMGIPIGPISSALIQEIIGTSIDEEFQKLMGKSIPGFRYTDDMEYYFNNLEEANSALSIMTKLLKEYNLDVNIEKTMIRQIPLEIDTSWTYYFKNFKFRNSKNREKQIWLEKNDLKEYFNQIFKYHIEINDKGISKYALKVLRNRIIYKENWSLFQSLLLQTALMDSSVIPTVFEVIESYKYKGFEMELEKLSLFVHSVIDEHINLNNDYEIMWALSFANKFGIHINQKSTEQLCKYENALVNILVMILNDKNLIHESADFNYYRNLIINSDLYDEHWIFLYECCINNWLGKDSTILSNDIFFNQLLQNNISFISPDYSSVKDEVRNIISNRCIDKYFEDKSRDLEELLEKVISEYHISLEEDLKVSIFERLQATIEAEEEPAVDVDPVADEEPATEKDPASEEKPKTEDEQMNNWTRLFLTSRMNNKQIHFSYIEKDY